MFMCVVCLCVCCGKGVSLRLPESSDLGVALQKYIQSNYTTEETRSVSKSINDCNALRQRMVAAVSRNAQDQDHRTTLEIFVNYYKLLSCLITRFPFQSASGCAGPPINTTTAANNSGGGFLSKVFAGKTVTQVTFPTTWYEAFRHSVRLSDIDIAFEKCSILFNIASLLSRQATQIKSSTLSSPGVAGDATDNNLKEACRLFQLSAGLFDHLARAPEIIGSTLGNGMSIDLNSESLAMLSVLMLAQAQACFFEKSTTTASPQLVAKLAMGVSSLFSEALQRFERNAKIKTIIGKSDVYPWGQFIHLPAQNAGMSR